MSFRSSQPLPRSLWVLAAGRGFSLLGDELALLSIAFRARAELGHWGVAFVMIAGAAPLVVFSAHAGLLVDRVRSRPLLIAATSTQAALCVALAFASSQLLIPLIALLACATAITAPAWQALVATMVQPEQLTQAFGALQSTSALASIAGPLLGGLLVAAFGFSVPLLADGATFVLLVTVFAALGLDRVPAPRVTNAPAARASEGFRLLASNKLLRSLLLLIVTFVITLGVVNVSEIFFITSALHAGPAGYGVLGLATGCGMIFTAALAGTIASKWPHPERLFVVGCVALCVSVIAFGLCRSLALATFLCVLIGAGNSLLNVNFVTMLTRHSKDESRGRVFSAVQGVASASQIGALALGGLLLTHFSAASIVVGGGVAGTVALALTVRPVLRQGSLVSATLSTQSDAAESVAS